MKYPKLFEPGKIGRLDIKNRVVVTPAGFAWGDSAGGVGEQLFDYLEERAKGGAGIVMPGVVLVDTKTGRGNPTEVVLENHYQCMTFEKLSRMIHKYDAKIFIQLHHPGATTNATNKGGEPAWAPSPVKCSDGSMAKEMTKEDIDYIVGRFANTARLAKKAGCDGVEIHTAHGYLLGQFLSPVYNHRTDEYGGSLENRTRIVREVYEAIRKEVGPNFVVGIRVSADEFIEGGNTLVEGVEMAKIWDAMGVDYINVNCGLQATSFYNREPPSFKQGCKRNLATSVKAVVKCPVIAVNTVKKPDFAESLLEDGVSDFVGLTRGHIADPRWVQKVAEGREDEIRICISCLNCMHTAVQGIQPTCTVNPVFGREYEFLHMNKNGNGRPVAVIGGGPAGMEASRILAARGFKVTLFEKEAELGGQLIHAKMPPNKEKIAWLLEGLKAQVKHAGVEVRLNTEATVEEVKKLNPVGVFVCCGSNQIHPNSIPGVNGENVYSVPDVLMSKVKLENKTVAIIGSGLAGMETGVFLGERGCKVFFVEMMPTIGAALFGQVLDDVKRELAPYGAEFYPGHKLLKINADSVDAETTDGKQVNFKADAVVLAMGVTPKKDVVDMFRANFDHVIAMGDAVKGARALEALSDGFTKAWVFDADELY